MKVRATALGYYGHKRRRPGEVFILKPFKRKITTFNKETKRNDVKIIDVSADMQFSENWMERADSSAKVIPSKPQKQFGKAFVNPEDQPSPGPARASHEPLSDEESLARDKEEESLSRDEEEEQDSEQDESPL